MSEIGDSVFGVAEDRSEPGGHRESYGRFLGFGEMEGMNRACYSQDCVGVEEGVSSYYAKCVRARLRGVADRVHVGQIRLRGVVVQGLGSCSPSIVMVSCKHVFRQWLNEKMST